MNPARQADSPAFADGALAAAVQFEYPDDDEPEQPVAESRSVEALEILRTGLLLVISDGHRDGAGIRAAALACLIGLYDSPADVAAELHVSRQSVYRAISRLKRELKAGFVVSETAPKTNNDAHSGAPE